MKFNYSPLPSITKRVVLAPMVPVTFVYKKSEFPTFALVDSGAEEAVISTEIADALSIAWNKLPAAVGFTLSGQFRYHRLENIEARIDSHSFSLNIDVVEGISPSRCILGRTDLFQKAKIIFEGYNKQFEILFRQYN